MSLPLNILLHRKFGITSQNQSHLGKIVKAVTESYKNSKVIEVINAGDKNIVLEYCDTYVKKPELRIAIEDLNKNFSGDTFYDEEIALQHDYVSLGGKDKFSFKHKRIGKENENGNFILENLLPMILKKLNIGEH